MGRNKSTAARKAAVAARKQLREARQRELKNPGNKLTCALIKFCQMPSECRKATQSCSY
jgi:hypothetical protein